MVGAPLEGPLPTRLSGGGEGWKVWILIAGVTWSEWDRVVSGGRSGVGGRAAAGCRGFSSGIWGRGAVWSRSEAHGEEAEDVCPERIWEGLSP